jgi:sugar/nucleoside kinase (ribokinase family)
VKAYDIITFGDLCVDLIMSGGDIVPRFGQVEQLVDSYDLEMGGSCSIFACQAAKLGLRVGILGCVGDDSFGELIVRRLDECGVDTRYVRVDPALKTGLGIALCKNGDRAILTYPGSLSALRVSDVTDEFLASARHLHYGSFFLHTGLIAHAPAIVQRARNLGLSISLDTNWDPDESWNTTLQATLPLVDVFLPNEQEARYITRRDTLNAAAGELRAQGVKLVAVKRGAAGAEVFAEEGHYARSVMPAEPGGDGIGAGDSFDAGFLAGWLRQLGIERSLALACLCGRGVAGKVGGLEGQPMWDEVAPKIGILEKE